MGWKGSRCPRSQLLFQTILVVGWLGRGQSQSSSLSLLLNMCAPGHMNGLVSSRPIKAKKLSSKWPLKQVLATLMLIGALNTSLIMMTPKKRVRGRDVRRYPFKSSCTKLVFIGMVFPPGITLGESAKIFKQ